jgi:hypothetical protein
VTPPPVSCNGCRTCCEGDRVALLPGKDNPSLYKTKMFGGVRVLAWGKDGNCIYLGPKGCKIHDRKRPFACETLDCRRDYALHRNNQATMDWIATRPHTAKVIAEGKRRFDLYVNGKAA